MSCHNFIPLRTSLVVSVGSPPSHVAFCSEYILIMLTGSFFLKLWLQLHFTFSGVSYHYIQREKP